jgi:hypothetical protein
VNSVPVTPYIGWEEGYANAGEHGVGVTPTPGMAEGPTSSSKLLEMLQNEIRTFCDSHFGLKQLFFSGDPDFI